MKKNKTKQIKFNYYSIAENMIDEIKKFSEEELKKLRQEILEWIEKNEKSSEGVKIGRKKKINFADYDNPVRPKIDILGLIKSKLPKIDLKIFKPMLKPRAIKPRLALPLVSLKKESKPRFEYPVLGKFWLIAISVIAVALIFDILGIYVFKIKNPIFAAVNRLTPFPVLKIENTWINYYSYITDLENLKKTKRAQPKTSIWYEPSDFLENNYTRYKLFNAIIKKNNLNLYNEDLADKRMKIVKNLSSDISDKILKKYVIIPEIQSQNLILKYKNSNASWLKAKTAAEKTYREIKEKKNFFNAETAVLEAKIVKQELGFVKRGERGREFDDIFFSLVPGEVGPLIESRDGFHIYKVTDRFMELDLIKIEEILIKPNVNFKEIFLNEAKAIAIKKII